MDSAVPSKFCAVCGDNANGTHYGALSCYGCKGFFRRAVINNRVFQCKLNKRCVVTQKLRCGCRYCRFEKCLQAGMKKEAITEKPSGTPAKKLRTEESPVDYAEEISIIDRLIEIERRLNEEIKSRFTKWMVNRANNENVYCLAEELRQFSRISLDMLIEWAKTIWPFAELQYEDQCHLLRNYAAQHLVLLAAASEPNLQCEPVKDARNYLGDMFVAMKNDEIAERVLEELVWPLRELQLQNEEFLCLKTLVFLCPEAKYLSEKARNLIRKARNELMAALFSFMLKKLQNTNYCSQIAVRYGKIILLGQGLQRVTQLICQNMKMIRFFGLIELDDVLAEFIVDLPPEDNPEEILRPVQGDGDLPCCSTSKEENMTPSYEDVDMLIEKTVKIMQSTEEVVDADSVIENAVSKLWEEEY